jgi:hypothetical protein
MVKPAASWMFVTAGRRDPYRRYYSLRPLGSEQ